MMKKLVVAGCAALALCAANAETPASANDGGITLDRVQQRYPWNGLVDIDYTLTAAAAATLGVNDNIEVTMIDKSVTPAVTNRALTFLQAPLPMTAGQHRITWNANADGVVVRTDAAEFAIEVAHYPEAYMVIDVSGGPTATTYPTTFVNRPPEGENGFNTDEYKTGKIVLRRIHPGSYVAGSPSDEVGRTEIWENQHRVAISQPFYIGIFPITQRQYLNVMGGTNPSVKKNDSYPVENLNYDTIRGKANTTTHTYDWPWNDDVDPNSFMGLLRSKCKSKDANGNCTIDVAGFDLPTEFQWEYACRAGTTGAFNTTNEFENTEAGQKAAMATLGQYNSSDHAIVGSYEPNQWGLYDMHGNVWEWCRDWFVEDVAGLCQYVDPVGPKSSTIRAARGSGFAATIEKVRAARRLSAPASYPSSKQTDSAAGFRLARVLP